MKYSNAHWLHLLYVGSAFYLGVDLVCNLTGFGNPLQCIFKAITGLPCFSCGTTRAVRLLFDGKILLAIKMHPNVIIFGLFFPLFTSLLLYDIMLRKSTATAFADRLMKPLQVNKLYQFAAIIYFVLISAWNIKRGV